MHIVAKTFEVYFLAKMSSKGIESKTTLSVVNGIVQQLVEECWVKVEVSSRNMFWFGLRVPRRQIIALLISENDILVLTQLVASDWLQLLFREIK